MSRRVVNQNGGGSDRPMTLSERFGQLQKKKPQMQGRSASVNFKPSKGTRGTATRGRGGTVSARNAKAGQAGRGQPAARGAKRGGRGGKGAGATRVPKKKLTKEELDKELDSYRVKDASMLKEMLNDDMDDYFKARPAKEDAPAAAEAAPAESS